ncbi:hypothetical protein E1301_Tti021516 [Triplophysa tibetana]|uniref:Uncharacterized protein n=1 Tax=Triplophysa tibetana TaxID=1572043 RepID=A0A5A9N023_9TELE|nr:hypothetical protein E1301_Tti021516 [Triplophysa tibetana]
MGAPWAQRFGGPGSELSLHEWKTQMEYLAGLQGLSEQQKLQFVLGSLDGEAKREVQATPRAARANAKAVFDFLAEWYGVRRTYHLHPKPESSKAATSCPGLSLAFDTGSRTLWERRRGPRPPSCLPVRELFNLMGVGLLGGVSHVMASHTGQHQPICRQKSKTIRYWKRYRRCLSCAWVGPGFLICRSVTRECGRGIEDGYRASNLGVADEGARRSVPPGLTFPGLRGGGVVAAERGNRCLGCPASLPRTAGRCRRGESGDGWGVRGRLTGGRPGVRDEGRMPGWQKQPLSKSVKYSFGRELRVETRGWSDRTKVTVLPS